MNKDFETWFTDNMTPYTFRSEWFYGDVEIDDKELRKDRMYKWLLAASVEENKIYRNLPFGFSYCCEECKSTMEACRIAYQLNSLPFSDHIL